MKRGFVCLNGNDVITAKVSDHHPIVHDRTLFWNIMMQGNRRKNNQHHSVSLSYNNAFGMVESEIDYIQRLIKYEVVAEIIHYNPGIDSIGFCEGPIQPLHVTIFFKALEQFDCMDRFTKRSFSKPTHKAQNWGLLMLVDNSYQIREVRSPLIEESDLFQKLANRFQIWEFKKGSSNKFFALSPFTVWK